jgi:hypothetical protein
MKQLIRFKCPFCGLMGFFKKLEAKEIIFPRLFWQTFGSGKVDRKTGKKITIDYEEIKNKEDLEDIVEIIKKRAKMIIETDFSSAINKISKEN